MTRREFTVYVFPLMENTNVLRYKAWVLREVSRIKMLLGWGKGNFDVAGEVKEVVGCDRPGGKLGEEM